jgi:hypothetical protein
MKQYQDDWAVVVDKLEKITTLLNNLGKWCAVLCMAWKREIIHQVCAEFFRPSGSTPYIPDPHIVSSFCYSSELDGLRRELEQSKKVRSTMKRIILRKDMARRVKQCDGKLSNLLQTFQVCRFFIICFTP